MGKLKSAKELDEQMNKAQDWANAGDTANSGMTYEEGVEVALRWALGEADEEPIENFYDADEDK